MLRTPARRLCTQARWMTGTIVLLAASAAFAQTATRPDAPAAASSEADSVKALERQVEAALQNGNTAFLKTALGEDLRFTHASGTSTSKSETLADFGKPGRFLARTLTAVDVELHGSSAISTGRIEVRPSAAAEYTLCYVRVYERRDARWQLISHRTFRQRAGFDETCAPR
jgi:hypothetical protein